MNPVCANCGVDVENRGDPSMDGRHRIRWVHTWGSYRYCDPQAGAASPTATPSMSPDTFLVDVMTLFAQADSHDTLLWWPKGTGLALWANVSDVFAWGSADVEEITLERLPVLRQALADLDTVNGTGWIAELYTARIRGMRPQGAAYPKEAAIQALFDACGPERPVGLLNPKPVPAAEGPVLPEK